MMKYIDDLFMQSQQHEQLQQQMSGQQSAQSQQPPAGQPKTIQELVSKMQDQQSQVNQPQPSRV